MARDIHGLTSIAQATTFTINQSHLMATVMAHLHISTRINAARHRCVMRRNHKLARLETCLENTASLMDTPIPLGTVQT